MKHAKNLQWIALCAAFAAWAGVAWFAWSISQEEVSRGTRVFVTQETENKDAAAARLRSVMQETAPQRARIDELLHSNIVSVVEMLEATGGAGVTVSVSDAHPETSPTSRAISMVTGITATGFVVEAQGSFSDLMHVVQRLENMPVPSTIGRLEMALEDGTGVGGKWHMSAYIRVLSIPEVRT